MVLDDKLKRGFLMEDAEFGAAWMHKWFPANYGRVIKNLCHS